MKPILISKHPDSEIWDNRSATMHLLTHSQPSISFKFEVPGCSLQDPGYTTSKIPQAIWDGGIGACQEPPSTLTTSVVNVAHQQEK
jgi:hypothetical protein